MNLRRYLLLGIAMVLVLVLYVFAREYLTVDRCLDAGGHWNYQLKRCEFQR